MNNPVSVSVDNVFYSAKKNDINLEYYFLRLRKALFAPLNVHILIRVGGESFLPQRRRKHKLKAERVQIAFCLLRFVFETEVITQSVKYPLCPQMHF